MREDELTFNYPNIYTSLLKYKFYTLNIVYNVNILQVRNPLKTSNDNILNSCASSYLTNVY